MFTLKNDNVKLRGGKVSLSNNGEKRHGWSSAGFNGPFEWSQHWPTNFFLNFSTGFSLFLTRQTHALAGWNTHQYVELEYSKRDTHLHNFFKMKISFFWKICCIFRPPDPPVSEQNCLFAFCCFCSNWKLEKLLLSLDLVLIEKVLTQALSEISFWCYIGFSFFLFFRVTEGNQKENLGIMVQYKVKVKLFLGSLGGWVA